MLIHIGTWHETAPRELSRSPSYYAADHEELITKAGDYRVGITFEGGYNIPMPYWMLIGIDCRVTGGGLYSGFAGVNFACTPIEPRDDVYTIQGYSYQLLDLIKNGAVTIEPQWAWLNQEALMLYDYMRREGWTWERLTPFAVKK